jgi:hypothetical protein
MFSNIVLVFLCIYFFIVFKTNLELIYDYGFKQISDDLIIKGKEGDERKFAIYFNLFNIIGLVSFVLIIVLFSTIK